MTPDEWALDFYDRYVARQGGPVAQEKIRDAMGVAYSDAVDTGVIAPEASMHGLQQKAGSWMDDFIAAIKNPDFSFDSYLADYRQTAEVIESL